MVKNHENMHIAHCFELQQPLHRVRTQYVPLLSLFTLLHVLLLLLQSDGGRGAGQETGDTPHPARCFKTCVCSLYDTTFSKQS